MSASRPRPTPFRAPPRHPPPPGARPLCQVAVLASQNPGVGRNPAACWQGLGLRPPGPETVPVVIQQRMDQETPTIPASPASCSRPRVSGSTPCGLTRKRIVNRISRIQRKRFATGGNGTFQDNRDSLEDRIVLKDGSEALGAVHTFLRGLVRGLWAHPEG
jgi:hypothetical protein